MASTSFHLIPSSSTSPPTLWDVFLSFRGLDTRYSFTDHLYKALQRTGIRTFKDDPELLSGEVISRALPEAIQESKTYIVVLSENYASSPWCLEELEEILDCYKQMKRLVIPVFYNIDPYVVRHQLESFKDAFEKHQTRFDSEKVKRWRITLNEVAGFSGYHISQNRSQADIVDEVVKRVLLETNPITLNVAKYPVGLDSRVKGVTTLFNSDTEGVIRIGLHGMGGVGKTTLAKAVYNLNYSRFQGSCFLANVREVSRTEKGLICLQKQLIADVLRCNNFDIVNVDQGIELIRARICSAKVLIVIDDLDNPKPLEYLEGSFASGSMVIITTRNEDLLDRIKVKAKYRVNNMDEDESLQLFAQHAFGDYKISVKFMELAKVILEHAGGLPLALQVFGSTLLDETEEGWRWFIDELKRGPIDAVEENLMISFDALKSVDRYLQDIFLDIACFYIGLQKTKVLRIMETCYKYVKRNIEILQKRCLITVDKYGSLRMHDLLRDMGREIARNNSPDEPEKHSRLWISEDIDSVLMNHKGTEAIQGIISGMLNYNSKDAEVTFSAESFKMMSKLRFLYLNGVNLTGSFEQTFKDLRWLRWTYCPLKCFPSEFYPHKLVILELPRSQLRIWELNMVFEKLKTLNMSHSRNLTTTPDFANFPGLETLNLACCWSLKEVHISIGSLVRLVSLDLNSCTDLRSLPDGICNLRALEVLDISYCKKLEQLPDQLGKITSLRELRAWAATQLKMIPDISQLSNIEDLDLYDCHHLLSIAELPPNLKKIRAENCWLLERLPNLSNLKHLKELNLNGCRSLIEIRGLEELTCLKTLEIKYFHGLLSISKLPTNLKWIDPDYCVSLERLPNLSNLKHLEELKLNDCSSLIEIPELPPNLKLIEAENCGSLERLPNLSNLKHLNTLVLGSCSGLTELQGLEEITSLEYLKVLNCANLLYISEFAPNLKQIVTAGCTSMQRLPNLSNLKHLKELNVINCSGLTELQGLEEITSLEYLKVLNCANLLYISEFAPNLKQIMTVGCTSMQRLPNLSNLKHLKELNVINCGSLTEIQGLEELTCLQQLEIRHCCGLLSISKLPTNLKWIQSDYCRSLERFPNVSNLKLLEALNFRYCSALTEIKCLEELTSLRQLLLTGCSSSLLASTLTKRFFQMLCGFQHKIEIYFEPMQLPDWISESSEARGSRMSYDLQPNESHSFLGIIFWFSPYDYVVEYSVKNMASGFTWSSSYCGSVIVILPRSILPIRDDCHNNIEIALNKEISYGIHLMYKTENTTISEYDYTVVNVEDERSNPLLDDIESNKNWLSLGSNTVIVQDE